jgi:hypothetical protein
MDADITILKYFLQVLTPNFSKVVIVYISLYNTNIKTIQISKLTEHKVDYLVLTQFIFI